MNWATLAQHSSFFHYIIELFLGLGCRSEGDKGGYSIYLEFSEDNLIFLNNFDTNPTAYSYYSSNSWNDNMRGNYLVDYIANGGKDENGDGIGDRAYDIPGTNGEQDKFTLWRNVRDKVRDRSFRNMNSIIVFARFAESLLC
jgi:nitrous oxidase accessory protein NosD